MSFPTQLTWDGAAGSAVAKGGTLVWGPEDHRPSQNGAAVPRVSVYGPEGTAYVTNQAATIEGPATIPTLTQAALRDAGATRDAPLTLSSTTGITSRMRLVLGTADGSRPSEIVRVRGVLSATQLRLYGPILHDHETGALIGGCRLTAAIASASMTTLFRGGRAVWEWGAEGSATRTRTGQSAVDCVRYPLRMLASEDDLRGIDPAFWARIAQTRDPRELLDRAWEWVNRRLGLRNVLGFGASEALVTPTALYATYWETRSWGRDWQERAAMWLKEATLVLDEVAMRFWSDPNEDGAVEALEQPYPGTVRIARAS
jgi:hypothetical protein